jgi:hypothetical protein
MLFLIIMAAIFVYSPTAVWALNSGGVRRLWLAFVLALMLILSFSLYLSAVFTVPNATRVLLFLGGFGGSTLFFTTAFLHLSHSFDWKQSGQALAAFGGGIVGMLMGMFLVVYGLRSW